MRTFRILILTLVTGALLPSLSVLSQGIESNGIASKAKICGNLAQELTAGAPSPDLVEAANAFSSAGGKLEKMTVTSPFDELSPFTVYAIEKLPEKASAQSPLAFMQTQHGLDFVRAALASGAILTVGDMPPDTKAMDLIKRSKFTSEVLEKLGKDDSSIILLGSDDSKYVLAHELEHWRRDKTDIINDTVQAINGAGKFLTLEEKELLQRAVLEMPGYGAEEVALLKDKKIKAEAIENGQPSKDLNAYYDYLRNELRSVYVQYYAASLDQILERLEKQSPQDYEAILNFVKKYDIPGTDYMAFTKIFKFRYDRLGRKSKP